MYLKENFGVMLPKQAHPYILDGKDQPKSVKRVFVTPQGYFPRMADITVLYGRSRREVEDRRIRNPRPRFDAWYVITNPTVEDVEQAIENVNNLYVEKYHDEDHSLINAHIDNRLFKDQCWVVGIIKHTATNIDVVYSYGGNDYTVTYKGWLRGDRPHKE